MSLPDGVYHLYPEGGEHPIVVEVDNDWVYSLHFEYTYHVSKFKGRFVRLHEVQEPVSVSVDNKGATV